MEEIKSTLENERTRLQSQLRDTERDQMQGDNQLQALQQEMENLQATNIRHQQEEKELMARLSNESDERERLQQELHQQKKKVFINVNAIIEQNELKILFLKRLQNWKAV